MTRLPESIETYGYFWLAEKPDNRLTGVLRISEKGDSSLEMFGAFDSLHNRPLLQLTGERLNILGVTDKAGPVTLNPFWKTGNLAESLRRLPTCTTGAVNTGKCLFPSATRKDVRS